MDLTGRAVRTLYNARMRLAILLLLCACTAASEPVPTTTARTAQSSAVTGTCTSIATVPVPTWAGWRTSGAIDPCVRLTRCAQTGCTQAACLHAHYGCLDSGTGAAQEEERQGAAFFVSLACCPG